MRLLSALRISTRVSSSRFSLNARSFVGHVTVKVRRHSDRAMAAKAAVSLRRWQCLDRGWLYRCRVLVVTARGVARSLVIHVEHVREESFRVKKSRSMYILNRECRLERFLFFQRSARTMLILKSLVMFILFFRLRMNQFLGSVMETTCARQL